MKVAYFVHELADAAVRRRIRMLGAGGCDVTLLGFARDRGTGAPASNGIVLGHTRNQKLVHRMLAIVAALPRALAVRRAWRDADVIIARNLEMLALTIALKSLTSTRARIVYECLDIHRLMSAPSTEGRMLRWLERACLKRVACVMTSSPAFEREHFRERQGYAGKVVLVENKVLALGPAPMRASSPQGSPWIIAWCGVLRCKRSFALLQALANTGAVRIELWGAPALDQIPDFHDALARTPNMIFRGAYTAEDLPAIYGGAHFAWAIDFYEAGGNSDWLLPNRLYESLAYGAVPLAVSDVETARWLTDRDVGLVLEAPPESALSRLFTEMNADTFASHVARVHALDPAATRDTAETCRALVQRLAAPPR